MGRNRPFAGYILTSEAIPVALKPPRFRLWLLRFLGDGGWCDAMERRIAVINKADRTDPDYWKRLYAGVHGIPPVLYPVVVNELTKEQEA